MQTNTSSRIPLSVRIPQEAADFIAGLEIEGATTPSDKIRALLAKARLADQGSRDYSYNLQRAEDMLAKSKYMLLEAEKVEAMHSALVRRLFEQLPDILAYLVAELPDQVDKAALLQYEAGAWMRAQRLMESMLQLALTQQNSCYNQTILTRTLGSTLELTKIIADHRQEPLPQRG